MRNKSCLKQSVKTLCVSLQVLAYTVACVGVSAFRGSLIDAAKAEEVMNTLRSLTEESQQVSGGGVAGCRRISS